MLPLGILYTDVWTYQRVYGSWSSISDMDLIVEARNSIDKLDVRIVYDSL